MLPYILTSYIRNVFSEMSCSFEKGYDSSGIRVGLGISSLWTEIPFFDLKLEMERLQEEEEKSEQPDVI